MFSISLSETKTPCMRSGRGRFATLEEHIAAAEQALCAWLVQNHAGIDATGDGEGDARGEVGLDQTGNHIDGRPLRGDDEVDTGGAG